ncbi:hypothetical protein [Streptomyces sp. NPDC050504]|uniref:hypothetical protein n=1 Tax=Streptomyces sp. NPDC050504 TaxID=3365618 RepID=UPI0037A41437
MGGVDDELEITRTDCPQCGAEVSGIEGRYACTLCGWTNDWSQGHRPLPEPEEAPEPPLPLR